MIDRVCLAGEFSFGRLGASWARAFEAIDVKVTRFDIREESSECLAWSLRNRIAHRIVMNSYSLRHWAARKYNEALVDRVVNSQADALILHNAEFVFPDTLAKLRNLGVRIIIFHADNPFPPHYNNRPETIPDAREADYYLIWSERLVDKLHRAGARDARFLPFAWDPQLFPYEQMEKRQWEGVLFIGGWDIEREAFLEQIGTRFPLKIYGPGYWGSRTRRGSIVRKCWMGTELVGPDAAHAMRECAININILRTQHYIDGHADGLIMRHFEVPGAGGFLLSTRSGGATRLLQEGKVADYFEGIDECTEKIAHYLRRPEERRRIAGRAHAEIAQLHQYTHRIVEITKMLTLPGSR